MIKHNMFYEAIITSCQATESKHDASFYICNLISDITYTLSKYYVFTKETIVSVIHINLIFLPAVKVAGDI